MERLPDSEMGTYAYCERGALDNEDYYINPGAHLQCVCPTRSRSWPLHQSTTTDHVRHTRNRMNELNRLLAVQLITRGQEMYADMSEADKVLLIRSVIDEGNV